MQSFRHPKAWATYRHVIDKVPHVLFQNRATQIKFKIKLLNSVRYSVARLASQSTPVDSTIKLVISLSKHFLGLHFPG